MKLIASLENCAQVSSFCSITVVRSLQTTSISYYSGPNTSILTICGRRSGGESLIRVAAKVVIFAQLIQGNDVPDSRQRSLASSMSTGSVLLTSSICEKSLLRRFDYKFFSENENLQNLSQNHLFLLFSQIFEQAENYKFRCHC